MERLTGTYHDDGRFGEIRLSLEGGKLFWNEGEGRWWMVPVQGNRFVFPGSGGYELRYDLPEGSGPVRRLEVERYGESVSQLERSGQEAEASATAGWMEYTDCTHKEISIDE